jgi:hypothetical protein
VKGCLRRGQVYVFILVPLSIISRCKRYCLCILFLFWKWTHEVTELLFNQGPYLMSHSILVILRLAFDFVIKEQLNFIWKNYSIRVSSGVKCLNHRPLPSKYDWKTWRLSHEYFRVYWTQVVNTSGSFHGGDYGECRLLGYYAAWILTSRKISFNSNRSEPPRRFSCMRMRRLWLWESDYEVQEVGSITMMAPAR